MGSIANLVHRNAKLNLPFDVQFTPGETTAGVGQGVDQVRATIFEWPILWLSTAYLWNRGFVRPNTERSFGIGDFLFVTVVSYVLKRLAVGKRWEGF